MFDDDATLPSALRRLDRADRRDEGERDSHGGRATAARDEAVRTAAGRSGWTTSFVAAPFSIALAGAGEERRASARAYAPIAEQAM